MSFNFGKIRDFPPFYYIWPPGRRFFRLKRLWVTIIFLLSIAVLSIAFNFYQLIFANRIYDGVIVGSFFVGGRTAGGAEKFLNKEIDKYLSQEFYFQAIGEKAPIQLLVSGASSADTAYSLVDYDAAALTQSAFNYGRGGSSFENVKDILAALLFGYQFKPAFEMKTDLLVDELRKKFGHLEKPPQNAGVDIKFKDGKTIAQVVPDRNGTVFDYNAALASIANNLTDFKNNEITVVPAGVSADIKAEEISVFVPLISKIFSAQGGSAFGGDGKDFKIIFDEQSWNLPKEVLADWIIFKKESGAVRLGLDAEKIKNYLNENKIVEQVEVEAKNSKFVFSADLSAEALAKAEGGPQPGPGKVVEFQASTNGKKINYDWTTKSFEKFFFSGEGTVLGEIKVDLIKPQVVTGQANTLGIEEVVGRGESNFAGSPKNRIFNIKNGSSVISGLIVEPGEIFSLNQALGEVSAATGYKAELVIKGDKTTPEFGGGLCQVATTVFRAALNAGLPIVSRANHSYRVSYYEPPVGMDATVYSPSPDLKFLNDTGAPILIQSKVDGVKLIFEFWGAKDGREISIGVPVVTNITNPPATKLIETTDLKPGVKKCTEKAHKGADAYFDYTVLYPNGDEKTNRFKSHYRAWQEVCLVGVVATSTLSGL